ncbi:MAG TPA: ATP synthase subunit I [Planctomicrobium sp.]|nr:ATP synthase subunit I [Planctomicrobium sp.]
MTVEQFVPVILAWGAGLLLGLIYFGGLWLTIRQLSNARRPVVLFLVSLVLRSAIAVTGFYLVMGNHWERAIACLVGFIIVRLILTSQLRPDRVNPLQASSSSTACTSEKEAVS